MREKTLFSEVTLRLSSHPENLATEALYYILQHHTLAWPSVRLFLGLSGAELPKVLSFKTQARGDEGTIPDLVGVDIEGAEVLLVEAKFWAGLTQNQPVNYINRLHGSKHSILCVITPALRFETLWLKLVSVCEAHGIETINIRDISTGFRCFNIDEWRTMALISWPSLLGVLQHDAEIQNDSAMRSDIDQLFGLCTQMDTEAFLPLQSNDLSPGLARRVKQYADLVDSVVAELVAHHGADTKYLSTGGSQATYGRYFYLSNLAFFFAYNPILWANSWETPMWLSVVEKNWQDTPRIKEELTKAFANKTKRVIVVDYRANVPIDLPLGVERGEVVDSVITQIKDIAVICKLPVAT